MFKKTFEAKNKSAIKGSDRKKLRSEMGRQFTHLSEEDLRTLVPNKEEMTTMKLVTHAGYNMIIYSLGKNPAFFELDNEVFPTVYTLWRFPELLPVFTTWPPVFTKLSAGADLMLPGIILNGPVEPNTFSHICKGKVCSVKLMGNKAPVAVGRAALSGSEMYESAMKGKGVLVMHTYRDLLWALGDKQDPPLIDDSDWVKAIQNEETNQNQDMVADGDAGANNEDVSNAVESVENTKEDGEHFGSESEDTRQEVDDKLDKLSLADTEGVCPVQNDECQGQSEESKAKPTQEDTDSLLFHCFLCALKSSVNKKSDLPLLTSTFFRNHMLKFCPPGQTVDIKKSSYKKLGKFLHAMQQQGFVKVKELNKGADSITEVMKDHPQLRGFVVPEVAVQVEPVSSEGVGTPPEITEMYTLTSPALPLFREVNPNSNKGDAFTVPEIRQIVQTYVKSNDLQRGSEVTIDMVLSPLTLQKGEYRESFRWDELLARIVNKMSPACLFVLPGQPPVLKKGKLEPITLKTATRAGNKKVTLIHNLEQYGIDLEQLAHTVQLAMACSSSVNELPGKGAGREVLVQGNQIQYVYQLLTEKYKVPKKYIQGLEMAPKSGKKKR